MNLTDQVIQEANYEGKSFLGESGRWEWSQYTLWDHQTPGLGVRISPNNAKVFVLVKLSGDQSKTITLGKVGELTLESARARAIKLTGQGRSEAAESAQPPVVADRNGPAPADKRSKPEFTSRAVPPQTQLSDNLRADGPRSGSRNRRKHPRLRVVMVMASSTSGKAEIMDLSRTGMAIEAQQSFPVGDIHGFLISNRTHQLEVDGRIQWCRAQSASGATSGSRVQIFQIGVAFTKIHTANPEGIFAGLRTDGDKAGSEFFVEPERPVEPGKTKPLVTIVTPRDGSTVYSSPVTVLGIIQGPLHDLPLEVEGVKAKIDGEWFEAEIPLEPGSNKISAVIPSKGSVLYQSPVILVTLDATEDE